MTVQEIKKIAGNRKTIFTQQIQENGFVGIKSNLRFSLKPFIGGIKVKVSSLRDVNYFEKDLSKGYEA